MPRGRSYDAEFRAQAVELSFLPGKTVAGVARDLGVNPKTLHYWRHRARKNGTVPTESNPPKRSEIPPEVAQELRELRKQVRELKQDNEILGKAVGWFANRNRGDSN